MKNSFKRHSKLYIMDADSSKNKCFIPSKWHIIPHDLVPHNGHWKLPTFHWWFHQGCLHLSMFDQAHEFESDSQLDGAEWIPVTNEKIIKPKCRHLFSNILNAALWHFKIGKNIMQKKYSFTYSVWGHTLPLREQWNIWHLITLK